MKKYPVNEYVTIQELVKIWPALEERTVRRWLSDKKCPYGIRRGKKWYIHPEQFAMWFKDVGP